MKRRNRTYQRASSRVFAGEPILDGYGLTRGGIHKDLNILFFSASHTKALHRTMVALLPLCRPPNASKPYQSHLVVACHVMGIEVTLVLDDSNLEKMFLLRP